LAGSPKDIGAAIYQHASHKHHNPGGDCFFYQLFLFPFWWKAYKQAKAGHIKGTEK